MEGNKASSHLSSTSCLPSFSYLPALLLLFLLLLSKVFLSIFNVFLKGFLLLPPITLPCHLFLHLFSYLAVNLVNAFPSLYLFTKICFSFILSLWSACLSCSFVFALRSAPGQDESTLSQCLSLLNSMSSAIYFHSPSFACSFLLASCSARVRALACRWFRTGMGSGMGLEWWCLSSSSCTVRTNPSSCSEIWENRAHERLVLPVPVPLAVCLSFLPFLPVTFSTESHAPGTSLCPWHGGMFCLLMSVQHCCRIE